MEPRVSTSIDEGIVSVQTFGRCCDAYVCSRGLSLNISKGLREMTGVKTLELSWEDLDDIKAMLNDPQALETLKAFRYELVMAEMDDVTIYFKLYPDGKIFVYSVDKAGTVVDRAQLSREKIESYTARAAAWLNMQRLQGCETVVKNLIKSTKTYVKYFLNIGFILRFIV